MNALESLKLARQPTSLASYMHIYLAANTKCYIRYMEGATLLAHYLQPIYVPLPTHTVPRMLRSYELYELAKLLLPYTYNPVTHIQIEDSIYELLR